ncbi:MAG: type II 3-dehydroquinate dehydratase [Nitrospirae bacterium RBG_16_64_22]|nr:MAG: type II 3-dehydroquinate dehydratase [Nitrospirae bacterium RBG_16_64_22]
MSHTARLLVLHGPNLNLLGTREPEIYGSATLAEIDVRIREECQALGAEVRILQSNHEGALVDAIQGARTTADALILNAAAYTHTSVAIRDAVAALQVPVVEVHLSNVFARERFRRRSLLSDVVSGVISGFGPESYVLGVRAALSLLSRPPAGR